MVQMNPQLPMNVAIQNTQSQKAIGNAGLATFRGLECSPSQDTLELSSMQDVDNNPVLPKVSGLAALFGRLSYDVVDQINETGKMPENMMVSVAPYGGYKLTWKNPVTDGQFTGGTQTLPPHLEVKNNIFGFTSVVPKGYENWLFPKYEDE